MNKPVVIAESPISGSPEDLLLDLVTRLNITLRQNETLSQSKIDLISTMRDRLVEIYQEGRSSFAPSTLAYVSAIQLLKDLND